ncbi:YciI family protein [Streptomyces sp. Li-HN-5-11]|uniref:YciI family protein n=1 Tax=Streptomyces sp. Li-HN-5-11 TaxID=3075432 RepID=UPI0028AF6AA5|nr:YciI family protein [Streptomyces sp. Li-HN-5-11]WNM31713.1 YciI family protein [Streptomyces sp. Li-HN-5-11]
MFVLLGRYARPLEEADAEVIARHRAYLDSQIAGGRVLVSGPREPRTGGLIVANVPDRPSAEALIDGDPFVSQGIATYELVEFHASMAMYAELVESKA